MIVVFDAQCLLCNSWVQFLLKHDKQGIFQFAAIQGKVGGQLLAVGVGLPRPCCPGAARHQGQDDQQPPAPLHPIDLHANTLSARAYSA